MDKERKVNSSRFVQGFHCRTPGCQPRDANLPTHFAPGCMGSSGATHPETCGARPRQHRVCRAGGAVWIGGEANDFQGPWTGPPGLDAPHPAPIPRSSQTDTDTIQLIFRNACAQRLTYRVSLCSQRHIPTHHEHTHIHTPQLNMNSALSSMEQILVLPLNSWLF